jgi:hypothetical protein
MEQAQDCLKEGFSIVNNVYRTHIHSLCAKFALYRGLGVFAAENI